MSLANRVIATQFEPRKRKDRQEIGGANELYMGRSGTMARIVLL